MTPKVTESNHHLTLPSPPLTHGSQCHIQNVCKVMEVLANHMVLLLPLCPKTNVLPSFPCHCLFLAEYPGVSGMAISGMETAAEEILSLYPPLLPISCPDGASFIMKYAENCWVLMI